MLLIKSADTLELEERDYQRLFEIVRIAYAETEKDIWGENYIRISYDAYKKLLVEGKHILVAFLNHEIVGSVYYYESAPNCYTFSLLSADLSKAGQGIGKALVEAVEANAKANGAEQICIEILRARAHNTAFKLRLADWYQRIGYVYTHTEDFAKIAPEKAKNLLQATDFDYYRKVLGG